MRATRAAVAGLVVTLLAACAGAPPGYGFVDPGHGDRRYDGFMTYAAFTDRAIEAAFEQALCERLAAVGHACTTMLHEAPPTREQDGASRHRASRASGAQAIVVIELAASDSASRRLLAGDRPAYEISVIDNKRQQVAARVFLEGGETSYVPVTDRAHALARRVVTALEQKSLLYNRAE